MSIFSSRLSRSIWRSRSIFTVSSNSEDVSFDGSCPSITPVKAIISGEGEVLANQLDAMIPRIRITELLNEVVEHTGFLGAFTNLRTGGTCPNESPFLAAILADATNLGLSPIANASQGITRAQVIWANDAWQA